MARAYAEFPGVQSSRLTAFPNQKGHDDLVLAREIPFQTVCAHHLPPLAGVAHVGYLPAGRFLGCPHWPAWSSTLPPARRPRNGWRRTSPDALVTHLSLRGAGVVLEAGHSCIPCAACVLPARRPSPPPCSGRCVRIPAPGPNF